jgi:hypothetical protein
MIAHGDHTLETTAGTQPIALDFIRVRRDAWDLFGGTGRMDIRTEIASKLRPEVRAASTRVGDGVRFRLVDAGRMTLSVALIVALPCAAAVTASRAAIVTTMPGASKPVAQPGQPTAVTPFRPAQSNPIKPSLNFQASPFGGANLPAGVMTPALSYVGTALPDRVNVATLTYVGVVIPDRVNAPALRYDGSGRVLTLTPAIRR